MDKDMLEKIQLQQVRLECLKLAVPGCEGQDPQIIIARADALYNYVIKGIDHAQ
jgi:hypothetical protein